MQFKLSVDEKTQLGAVLLALPSRNRQARLIELATFGLLASSGFVSGIGFPNATGVRSEDQIMVQSKGQETTPVSSSDAAISLAAEDGTVDFGELPDL